MYHMKAAILCTADSSCKNWAKWHQATQYPEYPASYLYQYNCHIHEDPGAEFTEEIKPAVNELHWSEG